MKSECFANNVKVVLFEACLMADFVITTGMYRSNALYGQLIASRMSNLVFDTDFTKTIRYCVNRV